VAALLKLLSREGANEPGTADEKYLHPLASLAYYGSQSLACKGAQRDCLRGDSQWKPVLKWSQLLSELVFWQRFWIQ
jgi:hypothetical protein